MEVGLSIFDIDVIAYSHFHPDHTGELVSLLFSSKYPDPKRRDKPLTLVGGIGFSAFFQGLKNIFGRWIELPTEIFRLIEVSDNGVQTLPFDGFDLVSIPVEHNPESLAYRVENRNGSSVVYSGDTDFTENLITLALNSDILFCEASHPDALKKTGHLSPSLAGEIATRANVGRLVLTHFYPEIEQTDVEAECRKTFGGSLVLAEDLLTFTI